jgi:hypothetical protein
MKFVTRLMLCALLGLVSLPAAAQREKEPTALAMAGDVVIARPLGIAITTVGAALFVVSLPFSALGGNAGKAAETLVVKPARETFVRCLGCPVAGRAE